MQTENDIQQNQELLHNVYKFPSTKQVIWYYHATVGLPTKTTWLKAIKAGFYITWPMPTATAVKKYFPASDETQQVHMCQNKQGLQSTKTNDDKQEPQVIHAPQPRVREIRVNLEDKKHTMYTTQMIHYGPL